ncbi:MAG: glycosyltransferase family 2 protein [Olegusella sp.]|jgi:rhamnosyltransferase|nr:glycosyltransferase family 2 protein [Olegusella sp.]MCC6109857.1 glycosyltransferase family 2 protein [Denitrobacterium sp.]
MSNTFSLIIPTLNAEREIGDLLHIVTAQSKVPDEIFVVDSSSDDETVVIASRFPGVQIRVIERSSFNHGTTRDFGAQMTHGDFICYLTQDAIPANDHYFEHLLQPFDDDLVALVSGRQLPKSNARRFEQLVRDFNYPQTESIRSMQDLSRYGIKTFFASDVCSAYRRSAYLQCGGFPACNTNEDMLMAAWLISAGYKVAYEPSASVFHSHNLSPKQQFNRNRAIGQFLEEHADDLLHASEIGEGGRLVKSVARTLLSEGQISEFFAFGVDCAARLLGNRAGRKIAHNDAKGKA